MFPPTQTISLDARAISGITGSISIACWVVVFSPQIIENFRRRSAEGLSKTFLVIWLAGDVFNVLGGVMQGVLPTMIILAVYYTIADIVLLWQCLYYSYRPGPDAATHEHHVRSASVDGSHLSPATPLLESGKLEEEDARPTTTWKAVLSNSFAVLMVCVAGVFGWWVSESRALRPNPTDPPVLEHPRPDDDDLIFSPLGQTFGYLCAVLYLGSRVPQIMLNAKRKSCEGVSILFFIFACLGNLTYVVSIMAFSPEDADGNWDRDVYKRYIAVNGSWLLGSVGTLLLDMTIFAQFFYYSRPEVEDSSEDDDQDEV